MLQAPGKKTQTKCFHLPDFMHIFNLSIKKNLNGKKSITEMFAGVENWSYANRFKYNHGCPPLKRLNIVADKNISNETLSSCKYIKQTQTPIMFSTVFSRFEWWGGQEQYQDNDYSCPNCPKVLNSTGPLRLSIYFLGS